jgi:hypothetical protein
VRWHGLDAWPPSTMHRASPACLPAVCCKHTCTASQSTNGTPVSDSKLPHHCLIVWLQ